MTGGPSRQAAGRRLRGLGAKRRHGIFLDDWTLLKRKFVVAPNPESPAPVLHTRNERTGTGRLLFLPLGTDLAPGTYTMTFAPEAGSTGYLIFSKITLEAGEKRTAFFRDGPVTEGQ